MRPVPAAAGISLKPQHFAEILQSEPETGWFELHPENYMVPGGELLQYLEAIRKNYPLSFHGVGMSLGSSDGLSVKHLDRLKGLVDRFQPGLVSEHLSWSGFGGVFYNDLLPLPYNKESLAIFESNIQQVQDALQREILVENPSAYFASSGSTCSESQFLVELATSSGCKILLDVNNAFVSARNQGFDARQYLADIPAALVAEIHLAGHATEHLDSGDLLIDDHGSPVCDDVWQLYQWLIGELGPKPTLIEWDTDVPALNILLAEAAGADAILLAQLNPSVAREAM